jgi:hypothetical protein
MSRTRRTLAVISWILAALGGGWVVLFLLSNYMSTVVQIETSEALLALVLPLGALLLAAAVHLWPRRGDYARTHIWHWFIPTYLLGGGASLLLLVVWSDYELMR